MASVPVNKSKIVVIDFPACVENHDKALEMLGGVKEIAKANTTDARLELKWRPQDRFCKPAFADKCDAPSLVLKISKSKEKSKKSAHLQYEMVGITHHCYRFNSMADFQYLPVTRQTDGTYQSFHDSITPSPDILIPVDWLDEPVPLFLPLPLYSRIDRPCDYQYKDRPISEEQAAKADDSAILIDRKQRPSNTKFMAFDEPAPVPTAPHPAASKRFNSRVNPDDESALKQLEQLFSERPLCTRSWIEANLRLSTDALKNCLRMVAFYWDSGPWRTQWCRFGYDPRTDSEARQYQLLDFRIKSSAIAIKAVRKNVKRLVHNPQRPASAPTIKQAHLTSTGSADNDNLTEPSISQDNMPSLDTVMFRYGVIPPQRQMFLQLCDIKILEVEELLSQPLPEGSTCTERSGWLPDGFLDSIRQLMIKNVEHSLATAAKQKQEQNSHFDFLDDESSSDDSETSPALDELQSTRELLLEDHLENMDLWDEDESEIEDEELGEEEEEEEGEDLEDEEEVQEEEEVEDGGDEEEDEEEEEEDGEEVEEDGEEVEEVQEINEDDEDQDTAVKLEDDEDGAESSPASDVDDDDDDPSYMPDD